MPAVWEATRGVLELVSEALQEGEAHAPLGKTIYEDVRIESEDDWDWLRHSYVPRALKEILRGATLDCTLYHKKDDVPGPEYVANCVTRGGRDMALGLDIDYDWETGDVKLDFVEVYRNARWSRDQLVHYHEV